MAGRILIVATSANKLLDGRATGCWVEEVASPFLMWREKGFQVDIASVSGGEIPWDAASAEEGSDFFTPEAQGFLSNSDVQQAIKSTPSVEQVLAGGVEVYDALFIPGGHGICFDGTSSGVKQVVEAFWAAGKVVSAVCHGPAGLVTAVTPNGDSILKGQEVTGFSNAEEVAVGKDKAVPFLLEDRMKELGGSYSCGPDWAPHAVASGKLITGQNPSSSKLVAELVIEALAPGITEPVRGKGPGEGFHTRSKAQEEPHVHHDEQAPHDEGAGPTAPDPATARQPYQQTTRTHQ